MKIMFDDTMCIRDRIRDSVTSVLADIRHSQDYAPEDFLSGVAPSPAGYGFYGYAEEGEILLLTKTNPFLKKPYIYTSGRDDVVANEKPVLSFSKAVSYTHLQQYKPDVKYKSMQKFHAVFLPLSEWIISI